MLLNSFGDTNCAYIYSISISASVLMHSTILLPWNPDHAFPLYSLLKTGIQHRSTNSRRQQGSDSYPQILHASIDYPQFLWHEN
jgi:hypothetical protein